MEGVLISAHAVRDIERLGYTPRQASFLALVASEGGYFLRRQYTAFVGDADGAVTTIFLQKALRLSHARWFPYAHKAKLYHLSSQVIYGAIGQPESRSQRVAPLARALEKVMLLDFALAHRDIRVVTSERERLAYLTDFRGATDAALGRLVVKPTRTAALIRRRLIDPTPLFFTADDIRPGFLYVQGPARLADHFGQFLVRHDPLFRHLRAVRIGFCTELSHAVEPARELALGGDRSLLNSGGERYDLDAVLAYFQARRRFDHREFSTFDDAAFERLRRDLQRFSGEKFESVYRRLSTSDATIEDLRPTLVDALRGYEVEFLAYVLPFAYPLLVDMKKGTSRRRTWAANERSTGRSLARALLRRSR